MVNRILFTFLLGLLLAGIGAVPAAQTASAQDESASVRALLQERDREIKAVLAEVSDTAAERDRLKDVINAGIDFRAMGRTALGPFWSEITPDQRDEFVNVFSAIVRNQSLSNLNVYNTKVSYKDVTVEGDSAYALTSTVYKDVPTDVAYVLGRDEDEWRVHDIIIDDVSTADGYARSFQTVIRKRGFDTLMQSLNKKLEQTNS